MKFVLGLITGFVGGLAAMWATLKFLATADEDFEPGPQEMRPHRPPGRV